MASAGDHFEGMVAYDTGFLYSGGGAFECIAISPNEVNGHW